MAVNLRLERHIRQTPEACFDLWTNPEELAKWWGPKDEAGRPFTAEIGSWSAVPGEAWSITMTAPDGTEYFQEGMMLEVVRPYLLRFSFAWITGGQRGPETEVRVEFKQSDSGTRMILEQIGFVDEATRDGHVQGWSECLDRLCSCAEYAREAEA